MDKGILVKSGEEHKRRKCDLFVNLSKNIANQILDYLTQDDIANLAKCGHKSILGLDCDDVWKSLFRKFYCDSEEEPNSEIYETKFRSKALYWRGRFMYNHALELNIRNRNVSVIDMPGGPVSNKEITVYKCLHFDNRRLIIHEEIFQSSSHLMFIDSSTGEVEYGIYTPFGVYFTAVIKHLNYVVALTSIKSLVIWSIEDGQLITEVGLNYNYYYVNHLQACKQLIVMHVWTNDNYDYQLCTYNIETKQVQYLEEPTIACCGSDTIATIWNGDIEIFDSDWNSLVQFCNLKIVCIVQMEITDEFFVLFFIDEQEKEFLTVWNYKIEPATCFNINSKDLASLAAFVLIPKKNLICLNYARKCEVWDLIGQNCRFTINLNYAILMTVCNERYIYISENRSTIKIFCLRTGDFVQRIKIPCALGDCLVATNSKLFCYSSVIYRSWWAVWQMYDFEANMVKWL